jgi:hypothetical protein
MTRIKFIKVLLTLMVVSATGSTLLSEDSTTPSLRMIGSRVTIDGQALRGHFSVTQRPFSFVYIYSPEYGAFIISGKAFPGSTEAGQFDGSRLHFQIAGISVEIESRTPLLDVDTTQPVWVTFDPSYRHTARSVAVGYGSTEEAVNESLHKLQRAAQ